MIDRGMLIMRFRREQSLPNVTRSRFYRMNPHFHPPQSQSAMAAAKRPGMRKHGKWFRAEITGVVMAALAILLFLLFQTEIDAWVKRHSLDTQQPHYVNSVMQFR